MNDSLINGLMTHNCNVINTANNADFCANLFTEAMRAASGKDGLHDPCNADVCGHCNHGIRDMQYLWAHALCVPIAVVSQYLTLSRATCGVRVMHDFCDRNSRSSSIDCLCAFDLHAI
jgi:hypothetical protein